MLYKVEVGTTETYEIEASSESEAYDRACDEWKKVYRYSPDWVDVEEMD